MLLRDQRTSILELICKLISLFKQAGLLVSWPALYILFWVSWPDLMFTLFSSSVVYTGTGCGAQSLHSVTAGDVVALVTTQAQLQCTAAYNGTDSPDIAITKEDGTHSSARYVTYEL